jgi:hypothetical protein
MAFTGFQKTVSLGMAGGVIGELFNDGPRRCKSATLTSVSAANNVFGNVFTYATAFNAQAGSGGARGFAGFLVGPKEQALLGDTNGTLDPSLTLPNGIQAELLYMGSIWVALPAAANIGDYVFYNNTTGALTTLAPGTTPVTGTTFANATVDYFDLAAAGLAVITVSPYIGNP